jgi:hypothetical protein
MGTVMEVLVVLVCFSTVVISQQTEGRIDLCECFLVIYTDMCNKSKYAYKLCDISCNIPQFFVKFLCSILQQGSTIYIH